LKALLIKHNSAANHLLWLDVNALFAHHSKPASGVITPPVPIVAPGSSELDVAPAPLPAATVEPTPTPVTLPTP
jgi:hypothetical protein